jgi:hypothetical protein
MLVECIFCTLSDVLFAPSGNANMSLAVKFGLGKHMLATDPTQGYKILMVSSSHVLGLAAIVGVQVASKAETLGQTVLAKACLQVSCYM